MKDPKGGPHIIPKTVPPTAILKALSRSFWTVYLVANPLLPIFCMRYQF